MNRGKKYQNRIGSFMHTIGADTGSEKNAGGFETVHGAEERDSAKKKERPVSNEAHRLHD